MPATRPAREQRERRPQVADQTTNYQCPACTGPLHFEASTGRLECEFCSSVFSVEEIEARYAEKDAKAAAAQAQADKKAEAAATQSAAAEGEASGGWSTSDLGSWEEDEGFRAYNCPSCGADLICDDTTAATACPYCDNPAIVPGKLQGALKPDYVIPFKLKKKDAIASLKKHYEGKPFLPKVFKDENHLDEIKGVYVPFWLFNGEAEGAAAYEGTNVVVFERGDHRITQTSHFDVLREGSVEFSQIPVDAASKMDNDYMDSIEPYDYGEMVPFSTGYLPGYFADRYDEDVETCSPRADARAKATLAESLRNSVTGYASVMERSCFVNLKRGKVSYALLPVWLLNTSWNGEKYTFAMNGQTGKFVGHLPTDKALRRSFKLKVFGAAFAVCLAVAVALGLFDLIALTMGA